MLKNQAFVIFLLFAQVAFGQQNTRDIAAIKSSRAASNAAIARHDVEGISSFWLPDFVQTRGNGTSLTGRDTITATWKELFRTNATVLYIRTPSSIAIGDDGKMAWETGAWVAKNSYSKGGNYSAMWRKINGNWKLQAELFVSLKK